MSDVLLIEERGDVDWVTMNRPDSLNALNPELVEALAAYFEGLYRRHDRRVVVLRVVPFEEVGARLMVDDPLPAGIEIDNPNLLRSGDVRGLDWLTPAVPEHAEFRSDRFLAAVDHRGEDAFELAFIARAVSPGDFHHPAASVEDMYRAEYRAVTDTSRTVVTE